MAINYPNIGQRLRAYRMAQRLTADEAAQHLGVSRAALYRIEAGEVVKIDTLERLSKLLNTSITSLLGVGLEYHSNPISYFERMRQLEAQADQIIAHFSPISYLLVSERYPDFLKTMMLESLPNKDDEKAREDVHTIMSILDARRREARKRQLSIINIVSIPELKRFLLLGLIGRFNMSEPEVILRKAAAQAEVEHLASLMLHEPMGTQIALIDDTLPNVTFEIFRCPQETYLAVSPFRLGELPNIRYGVATVTTSKEAVSLYSRLAEELWSRSHRGAEGAALLKEIVEASKDASKSTATRNP
jgi:transcriptional regulator with XRE-family HTH domain